MHSLWIHTSVANCMTQLVGEGFCIEIMQPVKDLKQTRHTANEFGCLSSWFALSFFHRRGGICVTREFWKSLVVAFVILQLYSNSGYIPIVVMF